MNTSCSTSIKHSPGTVRKHFDLFNLMFMLHCKNRIVKITNLLVGTVANIATLY